MGIIRTLAHNLLVNIMGASSSSGSSAVLVTGPAGYEIGRPHSSPFDAAKFGQEGYRQNVIMFACVCEIASNVAEPDLIAYMLDKNGSPVELPDDHQLIKLLDHPNPRQSQQEFVEAAMTFLEVGGNIYIHKARAASRMPVELHVLRPDLMRVVPDQYGGVARYEYRVGIDIRPIPAEDIIHIQNKPDPLDPYVGLSPIAVLSRAGDLDNFAIDYMRSFFLNAGIVSGILKIKQGRTTREQKQALRQDWREKFTTATGWHDIAILDHESVEYQEIGAKLEAINVKELFGHTETRICAAFQVPPILIGTWIGLLRSTYANYETARRSFWRETLVPKFTKFGDKLTAGLAAEFGTNIYIDFDLSGVDALQDEDEKQPDRALSAWDGSLITRNEARRLIFGLDPLPGPDQIKQKAADIFLDAETGEGLDTGIEPSEPDEEQSHLLPARRLRLIAGHEFHARAAPDWRSMSRIASAADGRVKKKFSRRSTR